MSTTPDDLEILIADVRKTISDNKQFLKTLKNDRDTAVEEDEEALGKDFADDDFEEL
jgi:hypothetical protein